MIAFLILVLVALLLLTTSWSRLPVSGRVWAFAACLNALVFFSMPTMAATSPWRPIVGRVLAASAGASLAFLALGLMLRHRQTAGASTGAAWVGPLILGTLPGVFYTFFWVIGPLY
jgi:hypothetical protein